MNDLDQLLSNWAARTEPTDDALSELQRRVVSAAASATNSNSSGSAGTSPFRDHPAARQRASWQIAVTAVALLLAATVLMTRPHERNEASITPQFPDDSIATRQSLFNELDRMFDGHWRWLGEVNGRVHLQTEEPVASEARVADNRVADNGVAVRLVVVQRRPGETNWRVVWEASVMARSDEWVRLPEELIGHDAVSVWAHALPDGSVLIESDVTLTAPVAVRSCEQHIFGGSERPTRLWSARRVDGEFQLIQSVARLETHHG